MIAERVVLVATVFLLGACASHAGSGGANATRTASMAKPAGEAIGLWRVPRGGRVLRDRFYFDGESVVLYLFTLNQLQWHSPDDIYRVQARWQGADLQYLPPFGPWTTVATFRNGHFENFERVSDANLEDEDRLLLQPREKHDYRRQTDGSLADAPEPR